MKIEELDLDIRQFCVLKRAGIDTAEDFINYPDKERLKSLTGKTYAVMEKKLLEAGVVSGDEISAPAQTETAVVFDYSELDSETAEQLGKISENVLNIKKKYIFDMAEQVKKAHDLLANHRNGLFSAWCESVGISRFTGNNLVNIVERFNNISSEQQENLNKLVDGNVKLLYEAARPSAPVELVEAVKNGDITTHKEYIELKKQLEEANEQLEQQKINNQHLSEANDRIYAASKRNREDYDKERLKALELQKRVEELESRPIDVAVDVDELNRRVEKVSIELQNQTARQIAAEREDFAQKLNRMEDENDELRAELEKAKSKASDTNVKTYLIKMTMDEMCELIEAVSNPYLKKLIQKAQVLRI